MGKGGVMSDSLFDESQLKPQSSTRCKNCKYLFGRQCGGSFFFYCRIREDRKTESGLKKVKCKTPSCYMFEKKG